MLKNVIKMRWIVYILYCCLPFVIDRLMIKFAIEAFSWTQMFISSFQMFIFPIFLTILIIRGKIIKKISLGILNSILSFVCWSFVSFFYSWIIFNIIVVEITYQVDKRKLFSK